MGAELHMDLNQKRGRQTDRRYVQVPVKVRRPSENWFKSSVADLSVHGFLLQSFMKLAAGDSLWVMLLDSKDDALKFSGHGAMKQVAGSNGPCIPPSLIILSGSADNIALKADLPQAAGAS